MSHAPVSETLQRLRQLQSQVVRDLAWCCVSAPLIGELDAPEIALLPLTTPKLWAWLKKLDAQPDDLIAATNSVKSTRLGLYYENLWRFYFSQRSEWTLLGYNQQVHRCGITLGAFDFLCLHGGRAWHLEAAVKFYLCISAAPENDGHWANWVGPNLQDRLDKKLHHLQQHQLPLSQKAEGKTWLAEHWPAVDNWQRGLLLQGYFFYRYQRQRPYKAASHANFYPWFTLSEFLNSEALARDSLWTMLERQRWLSPAQQTDITGLVRASALTAQLQEINQQQPRALLLARMAYWPDQQVWQEIDRCFVVPDDWPQLPLG